MAEDWFWACACDDRPADDRFVIEEGQEALFRRVRMEIARNEMCAWNAVHPDRATATIADILDMALTIVPTYQIKHNRFMIEAAQIKVFAKFLRHGRAALCNYISNPSQGVPVVAEPFNAQCCNDLGLVVSETLGCTPDWFE